MPRSGPAVVDDRPGESDGAGEPGRVARARREDDAVDVRARGRPRRSPCAAARGRGRRARRRPGTMFALRPKSTIATSGAALGDRVADLERGAPARPADEVLVLPARPRPGRAATGVVDVRLAGRRDDRAQAAVRPQVAGERSRVDPGDRRDPAPSAGAPPAGPPARRRPPWLSRRRAPRSHGRSDWSSATDAAVVADERVGHDDDLAGVRGVGADLLVAGLARVDDEVAAGRGLGAPKRDPGEDGAVLEREESRARGRRHAGRR